MRSELGTGALSGAQRAGTLFCLGARLFRSRPELGQLLLELRALGAAGLALLLRCP